MKKNRTNCNLVHAVVPLKVLKRSKTRLSTILGPKKRAELAVAMLEDVLFALRKSRMIVSTTVVSADRSVLKRVREFGADPLPERQKRGLNHAIRRAIRERKLSDSAVLIVHADLPLLSSAEVRAFLKEANGYPIAIAPSKDGRGTNAMLLNPARIIQPAFGRESYRRHLSILHERKIPFKVQRTQGFGFDIDEPNDLLELMHHGARNNTAKFLRAIRSNSRAA